MSGLVGDLRLLRDTYDAFAGNGALSIRDIWKTSRDIEETQQKYDINYPTMMRPRWKTVALPYISEQHSFGNFGVVDEIFRHVEE